MSNSMSAMKSFGTLFLLAFFITIQYYSVNSSVLNDNVGKNFDDQTLQESDGSFSRPSRFKRGMSNVESIGTRIEGADGVTGIIGGAIGIGKAAMGERCREKGCHEGYCWAWCGITYDHGEWCYTTKTFSQSYKYVKCSNDSECNGCWHCAGPCALF